MKLNLPNKITIARIILGFIIIIMLLLPWQQLNIDWPIYLWYGVTIDLLYIVVGILFIIASCTDFIDGYIARKYNMVTDFGKTMDAIADKILVNGLLIILAYERAIPILIPVVIITRDIITDTCKSICGSKGKVVAASNLGKLKTIFIMVGLAFVLFYNFPFAILNYSFPSFNTNIAEIILLIGTLLSVISGVEYVSKSLPYMFEKEN